MTSTLLLLPFPQRVYNVLRLCEEQGREDIISWENNGTAFKVNDVQKFERDLLPTYFTTKKYYSFTRALYSYGFSCVRAGRETGIYYHPRFNRNDPFSPSLMRRVTREERKKLRAPNHANISNPPTAFVEAANKNRPSSRSPSLQFPPVLPDADGTRVLEENGIATVFGREYHTIIASQVADRWVPSLPASVQIAVPGSELSGGMMIDNISKGRSVNTRSHPILSTSTSATVIDPTSSHCVGVVSSSNNNGTSNADRLQQYGRIPIARSNVSSLFVLESGPMAPIMESLSHEVVRNGYHSEQQEIRGGNLMVSSCHVPDDSRHIISRSRQEQAEDISCRMPVNLQEPTKATTGYPTSHSSISPPLPSLLEPSTNSKGDPPRRSDDQTAGELESFIGSL